MEFEEFERMKIFVYMLIPCWNFKNYFWTRMFTIIGSIIIYRDRGYLIHGRINNFLLRSRF